jgi:hypothetical protein
MATCPPRPGPPSPHTPRARNSDAVTTATRRSQLHNHHSVIVVTTCPPRARNRDVAMIMTQRRTSSSPHPRAHNGDVATTMTQRSQPHYRHVVIVTAMAASSPLAHLCSPSCQLGVHLVLILPLVRTPSRAQRRRGDNDDATIATALSSRHHHDCPLRCARTPRTALCAQHAHARPRSILGNYLICTPVSKMEISPNICFFFFSSASFLDFISSVCRYVE